MVEEIDADMDCHSKVDLIVIFFPLFSPLVDNNAIGDPLTKIVHDQFCVDFLDNKLFLFCMKVYQTNINVDCIIIVVLGISPFEALIILMGNRLIQFPSDMPKTVVTFLDIQICEPPSGYLLHPHVVDNDDTF